MKLLFVLDELFPVRGAPAVRIRNLMQNFPNAQAIGGKLDDSNAPANYTLLARPSERSLFRFVLFLIRLGFQALKKARKEKPDVIVLSVPKYEMLLFAPALSRLAPVFILDIRDSLAFLDYAAYLRHFLPSILAAPFGAALKQAISFLQNRAIRAASIVTVANEGIAQSVKHPRVVVVSNGVDTELFRPGVATIKKLPLRLVYLGNFAEKDRFDWIEQYLPRFGQSTELHLIGSGRNKQTTVQRLRDAGISLVDHDLVAHDELPQLLSTMHLGFIFRKPGVDESIPVCLYEFIAMGVASLCNDTGLMAQFIRQHQVGWVLKDVDEFEKCLAALLQDITLLDRFKDIHLIAEAQFSLFASAEKFKNLVNANL